MAVKATTKLGFARRRKKKTNYAKRLAMIKSGRREEAAATLSPLIQNPGPYEAEARKLKKILLK